MAKLSKQEKINKIEEYIRDYVPCFTPCMSTETTERWIGIFGKKMCERRLDDDNLETIETQLGFAFSDKDKKDFRRLWKEIFKETMQNYIEQLKKAKTEEEKAEIKKNGIKRKIDSPSKKKNKK